MDSPGIKLIGLNFKETTLMPPSMKARPRRKMSSNFSELCSHLPPVVLRVGADPPGDHHQVLPEHPGGQEPSRAALKDLRDVVRRGVAFDRRVRVLHRRSRLAERALLVAR